MSDDDNECIEEGALLPGVWPAPVNLDGVLEGTVLTDEQEARVSALYHARSTLERRGVPLAGKDSSVPPPVNELIKVARYILEGE